MERQPLSYLPIANIKVGIEHLEEYTGRFGSTMLQRDNLVTTYNHRFGVDWFHAFQSFQSLQPFHVNATFNSGWRFDPAAPGQYGSPGIIYGAAIHRQEMIPLNMEMRSVIKENRNPPKRNTAEYGVNRIDGDEVNASNARGQKCRTAFAQWQKYELEAAFLSGHYPDSARRQELSVRLSVDEPRLQVWFQNRRARWRRLENTRKGPGRPSLHQPPSTCSGVPITRQELEMRRRTRTDNRKRKCMVASPSGVEAQPDVPPNATQSRLYCVNHKPELENRKLEVSDEPCALEWKAEVKNEMSDSGFLVIDEEDKVENISHNLIDYFRRCSTPTDPSSDEAYAALNLFSDSLSPDDEKKPLPKRSSEQFYPITMSNNQTSTLSINKRSHKKLIFSIDSILAR